MRASSLRVCACQQLELVKKAIAETHVRGCLAQHAVLLAWGAGETMWYSGQGGNNALSDKKQSADQQMLRGNLALVRPAPAPHPSPPLPPAPRGERSWRSWGSCAGTQRELPGLQPDLTWSSS